MLKPALPKFKQEAIFVGDDFKSVRNDYKRVNIRQYQLTVLKKVI